jgi:hypothetical protein
MKNNIKIALALLGLISLSGNLQAQTVTSSGVIPTAEVAAAKSRNDYINN